MSVRSALRTALSQFDIRVERLSRHPSQTLLGLSALPIRTVIDIGANEGQFAKMALDTFPQAQVVSFEPLPSAAAVLKQLAYAESRLTVYQTALGADAARLPIHFHEEHSPSSSLLATTAECEKQFPQTRSQVKFEVQVQRLNDVLADTDLEQAILVKIDVQGFEAQVIDGGTEVLSKAQACIVEINLVELYDDAPSFEDISHRLNKFGLYFHGTLDQHFGRTGQVVFMDAVFARRNTWAST